MIDLRGNLKQQRFHFSSVLGAALLVRTRHRVVAGCGALVRRGFKAVQLAQQAVAAAWADDGSMTGTRERARARSATRINPRHRIQARGLPSPQLVPQSRYDIRRLGREQRVQSRDSDSVHGVLPRRPATAPRGRHCLWRVAEEHLLQWTWAPRGGASP